MSQLSEATRKAGRAIAAIAHAKVAHGRGSPQEKAATATAAEAEATARQLGATSDQISDAVADHL